MRLLAQTTSAHAKATREENLRANWLVSDMLLAATSYRSHLQMPCHTAGAVSQQPGPRLANWSGASFWEPSFGKVHTQWMGPVEPRQRIVGVSNYFRAAWGNDWMRANGKEVLSAYHLG